MLSKLKRSGGLYEWGEREEKKLEGKSKIEESQMHFYDGGVGVF